MNATNLLTAITLLTQLTERAAGVANLIGRAQAAGRDVTDDEIDQLRADDDVARADLEKAIAEARNRQAGRAVPALLLWVLFMGMIGACIGVAVAAAPAVRQASLSWVAPTQYTDGTPITTPLTYNVYRGARGSAKARIATGVVALAYVDSGRPAGVEECYQVSAVAVEESALSAEGCKSYPALTPAAPVLTVQ